MSRQRLFHHLGAGLERLQQVAMPALEVLQDIGELAGNGFGIECKNPVDDMIGAGLVGRVEIPSSVAGERAHNHARWVRTQIGACGSGRWVVTQYPQLAGGGGQIQAPTARSAEGLASSVPERAS